MLFQMTQVTIVACCRRQMLHKSELLWAAGGQEEPVTTVECAFCTQNLPARYPLVAGKGIQAECVFEKERVLIDLLCLMEMWTTFGLGSFAAYNIS